MKYYTVGAGRASAGVFADVAKDDRQRLARAMKAVLLATRAWKRDAARYAAAEQKGVLCCDGGAVIFRRADAERRLYAAQERLAKIEREVSRG